MTAFSKFDHFVIFFLSEKIAVFSPKMSFFADFGRIFFDFFSEFFCSIFFSDFFFENYFFRFFFSFFFFKKRAQKIAGFRGKRGTSRRVIPG